MRMNDDVDDDDDDGIDVLVPSPTQTDTLTTLASSVYTTDSLNRRPDCLHKPSAANYVYRNSPILYMPEISATLLL